MSIVARGLGIEPTALVGPSVWGYTLKPVVPPPVVQSIDPFAKKANTQVIRESHLRKFLKKGKRRVQRVDLQPPPTALGVLPAVLVGFTAADARHIEKAARLLAAMASEPNYPLERTDIELLEGTPAALRKIH